MEKYLSHIKKTSINFKELRKRFYTITIYNEEIKLQGYIKDENCDGWNFREEGEDLYYNKKLEYNGHKIEICLTNN